MKYIILSAAVLFTINAKAQKVKEEMVPKAIVTSFQTNFVGAKAEAWEKEKDGSYEAEFNWNKVESSATFAADGKLMETEQEIKTAELPKSVAAYITKNYAGYKIIEAAKITEGTGKVMFEAEVKKGKETFDLIFDKDGNFVKKITPTKEDDEEDDDKK